MSDRIRILTLLLVGVGASAITLPGSAAEPSLLQLGEEALASLGGKTATVETIEGKVTSCVEAALRGVGNVKTTLHIGTFTMLTNEAPLLVVGSDGDRVLAVAQVRRRDETFSLATSSQHIVELAGDIDARELTKAMYALAGAPTLDDFNVHVFRDGTELQSVTLSDVDDGFRQRFIETTGLVFDDCFPRRPDRDPPACECHVWAHCRNDPGRGRSCNVLRGKCHGGCF